MFILPWLGGWNANWQDWFRGGSLNFLGGGPQSNALGALWGNNDSFQNQFTALLYDMQHVLGPLIITVVVIVLAVVVVSFVFHFVRHRLV